MSKKLHELYEKTVTEGNEYLLIDDSNGEGDSKKLPVSAITKPLSDKYNAVAEALEEVIDKYDNVADALQELILNGGLADGAVYKYKGSVSELPTATATLSAGDTYSVSDSYIMENGSLVLDYDYVPLIGDGTTYEPSIINEKIPGRESSNYAYKTILVGYFDEIGYDSYGAKLGDCLYKQTINEECVKYNSINGSYIFTLNTEDLPDGTRSICFYIEYFLKLEKGDNVAWTGEYWDKFSATIDTSEFLKAEDLGDVQNSIDTLEADTDANTLLLERLKYYGDANIVPTSESEFTALDAGGFGYGPYHLAYKGSASKVVVPYKISNGIANELAPSAFSGNTTVKSVILPETITFGGNAFSNCIALESIIIPKSVNSLYETFNGCVSLKSVTIPDSVTYIESKAFKNCISLRDLVIPDSVTSIESDAFTGCDNLIIICGEGSLAETYAKENSVPYKHYAHDNGVIENAKIESLDSGWVPADAGYAWREITEQPVVRLLDNCETHLSDIPIIIKYHQYQYDDTGETTEPTESQHQGFIVRVPETISSHYESYLSFVGGDTAPTIQWPSGIIFRGDDCSEDGIFTPVANTNYEIAFKYMGTSDESGIPTIIARVGSW